MASFSRSGETLLLRCLNAHPNISVVHQIRDPDQAEDITLFKHLMNRETKTISSSDPLLSHRYVSDVTTLLLKNAVWTHQYPRDGFTLVRNPFSTIVSAKRNRAMSLAVKKQRLNQVIRWSKGIDPLLIDFLRQTDPISAYSTLIQRKLLQDRRDGLPFVRYEDFVRDPKKYLLAILSHLGLPWHDAVLHSHREYADDEIGHGGIRLSQPIHSQSSDRYKELTPEQFGTVYAACYEMLSVYGYRLMDRDIHMYDVDGML